MSLLSSQPHGRLSALCSRTEVTHHAQQPELARRLRTRATEAALATQECHEQTGFFFGKSPGKIALTFGRARPGFEALTTAEQHRERSEDCETREPEIKQDE